MSIYLNRNKTVTGSTRRKVAQIVKLYVGIAFTDLHILISIHQPSCHNQAHGYHNAMYMSVQFCLKTFTKYMNLKFNDLFVNSKQWIVTIHLKCNPLTFHIRVTYEVDHPQTSQSVD